jgi:hypothetical protein
MKAMNMSKALLKSKKLSITKTSPVSMVAWTISGVTLASCLGTSSGTDPDPHLRKFIYGSASQDNGFINNFFIIDQDGNRLTTHDQYFSGYKDADGNGLISEDRDGSDGDPNSADDDPVNLGLLIASRGSREIALAAVSGDNNNDKFRIDTTGHLIYVGLNSGNFEENSTLKVAVGFKPATTSVAEGNVPLPTDHFLYKNGTGVVFQIDKNPVTVDGTDVVSIVLFRPERNSQVQEAVEIVGQIKDLDLTTANTDYHVWAQPSINGDEWSLLATTIPSGPTGREELLYTIATGSQPDSSIPDTYTPPIFLHASPTVIPAHVPAQFRYYDPDIKVAEGEFVYLVDPDGTPSNGDEYYIKTGHDIAAGGATNDRLGDDELIAVTLLRETGPITITSLIAGLTYNGAPKRDYHHVWAVKADDADQTWSLLIERGGTTPTSPAGYTDPPVYLYTFADATGGTTFTISGATQQAAGTVIDIGSIQKQQIVTDAQVYNIHLRDVDVEFTLPPPAVPTPGMQPITVGNATNQDIDGTSGDHDEIIQGGGGNDRINPKGGDDLIIGGYGDDEIKLSESVGYTDTVFYRFESDGDAGVDGDWKAVDGRDLIDRFILNEDKLILVDTAKTGTPVSSLADFIADGDRPVVEVGVIQDRFIASTKFIFDTEGTEDGTPTGTPAGRELIISYSEEILIYPQFLGNESKFKDTGKTDVDNTVIYELIDYTFLDDLFGGEDFIQIISEDTLSSTGLTIL